jgi:hypothetical protein
MTDLQLRARSSRRERGSATNAGRPRNVLADTPRVLFAKVPDGAVTNEASSPENRGGGETPTNGRSH